MYEENDGFANILNWGSVLHSFWPLSAVICKDRATLLPPLGGLFLHGSSWKMYLQAWKELSEGLSPYVYNKLVVTSAQAKYPQLTPHPIQKCCYGRQNIALQTQIAQYKRHVPCANTLNRCPLVFSKYLGPPSGCCRHPEYYFLFNPLSMQMIRSSVIKKWNSNFYKDILLH